MINEIRAKAATLIRETLNACRDRARNVLGTIRDGLTALYQWHRRLMMTNPAYPVAILSVGKAIIRITAPSSAVAAAAVALLAALLNDDDPDPGWDWRSDDY